MSAAHSEVQMRVHNAGREQRKERLYTWTFICIFLYAHTRLMRHPVPFDQKFSLKLYVLTVRLLLKNVIQSCWCNHEIFVYFHFR